MFTQIKARKHANAISTETARLLGKSNNPDAEVAISDVAYLWGWFEAVDICIFNINEKMDLALTKCFFKFAYCLNSSLMQEIMRCRMETSLDLVNKVKDSIGTTGIMPLLAQYGANYLCENDYGTEDEMFVELLEAIKRIRKTI